MSNTTSGRTAYAVYAAAVGGTTFDDRPLPTFDQLGERQQKAWQAVADQAATPLQIGHSVRDAKRGVRGTVRSIHIDNHQHVGAWLDCIDNTSRPFEHYAELQDIRLDTAA